MEQKTERVHLQAQNKQPSWSATTPPPAVEATWSGQDKQHSIIYLVIREEMTFISYFCLRNETESCFPFLLRDFMTGTGLCERFLMAKIPLAPLLYDFPAEALAHGPSLGFTHHLTTVPSTSTSQTRGCKDKQPLSLGWGSFSPHPVSHFYPDIMPTPQWRRKKVLIPAAQLCPGS